MNAVFQRDIEAYRNFRSQLISDLKEEIKSNFGIIYLNQTISFETEKGTFQIKRAEEEGFIDENDWTIPFESVTVDDIVKFMLNAE